MLLGLCVLLSAIHFSISVCLSVCVHLSVCLSAIPQFQKHRSCKIQPAEFFKGPCEGLEPALCQWSGGAVGSASETKGRKGVAVERKRKWKGGVLASQAGGCTV